MLREGIVGFGKGWRVGVSGTFPLSAITKISKYGQTCVNLVNDFHPNSVGTKMKCQGD